MSAVVKTPAISANEDTVLVTEWLKAPGTLVHKGETVCAVETTKANVEVQADADGYLHHAVPVGTRLAVGAVLAVLTDRANHDPAPLLAEARDATQLQKRWTKKAAIVARRLGIRLEALAARFPDKVLSEEDVLAAQSDVPAIGAVESASRAQKASLAPTPFATAAQARPDGNPLVGRYATDRPERILLLGGGAGAGVITLDALSRVSHQRAVGILDKNAAIHGKTIAGVPVLGSAERTEELWRTGLCDSVIILFTDDPSERAALFDELRAKGMPFANVIDPSTQLRGHVKIGQGNLIMGNCFLAACVTLGDNNFLASHTCVEHHSTIGSHCTFGPRTTMSGAVKIGDRVKTGMAVAIEPYIKIGNDTLVASGCVVTNDVPSHSLVKAQHTPLVRPSEMLAPK